MPDDSPVIPTPPVPGTPAKAFAFSAKGVGAFLMVLCYGFQSAAAAHPEVISALGPWCDVGTITGLLSIIGGVLMDGLNTQKQTAAIAAIKQDAETKISAAACAPPVDADGEMSARHTCTHALQQAANEGDFDMVDELSAILRKRGVR